MSNDRTVEEWGRAAVALPGAPASAIDPDDSVHGVYPAPDGPKVVRGLMGEEIRGWPVRVMTGAERVVLTPADNGNGYVVDAEPWVKDRLGHWITGRDGRKLDALTD